MPIWLVLQLGLLAIWIVLAFLYYYSKGWRVGLPFQKDQVFKLLFSKIVPIVWMGSSLILGVIYILFNTQQMSDTLQIVFMVMVPIASLFFIFYRAWLHDKKAEEVKKTENKIIKEQSEKTIKWVHQFDFVKEDKIELMVYISRDKPVGKLTVYDLTGDQQEILNQNKQNLPTDVYLEMTLKKSNLDNRFKH
ncbi:hypothetical protein [Paenibacillus polymyxa]|uniref:hypothetical protein n=1 Tax=Paenibacillus polymyxa TaxID=1406 RepID=UPI00083D57D1|nr:hypothetical protein [Paenibacillus polymyxa]ODB61656.1 hypothetical protein A7309_14225 [Paenibacillus polymyxa]